MHSLSPFILLEAVGGNVTMPSASSPPPSHLLLSVSPSLLLSLRLPQPSICSLSHPHSSSKNGRRRRIRLALSARSQVTISQTHTHTHTTMGSKFFDELKQTPPKSRVSLWRVVCLCVLYDKIIIASTLVEVIFFPDFQPHKHKYMTDLTNCQH